MQKKQCTIIIAHHNRHDHLKALLERLSNELFDIIIVSGGSFAENNNRGALLAQTEKMVFINDDALPTNDDILKICNALVLCDFVGATQLIPTGLKYFGIHFTYRENGYAGNSSYKYFPQIQTAQNRSLFPSGFLFGMKKKQWQLLKGFDTNFKTGYEDVDFGIRCLQANFSIAVLDLEIVHNESQSEGRFKYSQQNIDLFHKMYSQEQLKQLYENTNYCI